MYEKNKTLIRRAQEGDEKALELLIEENNGLIWSVVRKFWYRDIEPEDLYQIACIGFIKAVRRFDFHYQVELSTYAVQYIFGEIKKFLRDDGMIKVSREIKKLGTKIKIESINQYIYEDGNCQKQETIAMKDNEENVMDRILVSQLLDHLNTRDRQIIQLRFFAEKTQTEVAQILGISQVQVSRIERKVLQTLKTQLSQTM